MEKMILEATKKLIRFNSLSFTMDDIAKELGISKKTLYQHYKSKEDIICTVILEMQNDMEQQQIELFNDNTIPLNEKLRALIKILPKEYDLINPITLNQLKKSFPKIFKMVNGIYHNDWTRFDDLYEKAVYEKIVEPFDTEFMKELYIVCLTTLPELESMAKYNQKEIVEKIVELIFNGVEK